MVTRSAFVFSCVIRRAFVFAFVYVTHPLAPPARGGAEL